MIDLRALRQLTLNRVRVMLREPEVLFWIFLFPVLLALGIGVAFGDPSYETFRVAIERGSIAESYMGSFEREGELDPTVMARDDAEDALRRGEVALIVGNAVADGSLVIHLDPTRPESRTAQLLTERALQAAAGNVPPLAIGSVEERSQGRRYIDWLIPGLIGFNLMGTGLWSVGFYTTQARENRELRRLVATPMKKSDFLLAQIFARFAFLLFEVPLIIFVAWLAFGVPMQGHALSLAAIVILGASCFTGLGLLAASRARTTEGVGGIINLIMMPMLIFSGVFFSVQRFPEAAQPFIRALPLTALNDALRAVYNDGLALHGTLPAVAVLGCWTVGAFVLALRLFRWQ